jgi:mono/diheme cytochrome c family protein
MMAMRIAPWPHLLRRCLLLCLLPCALALPATATRAQTQTPPGGEAEAVRRGETVFRASGGCGCHTDYKAKGQPLAGGRGLKTPFGTFYSTNVTPDPETGLGNWSAADFVRAMREGIGPQGQHYFPVFPYTSFTRMSDADLADLWAYLRAQPAVRQPNKAHDVWPPFGWRIGVGPWKLLFFRSARFAPDPARSESWNRGAYLAGAVAHCGECHTPRNLLGGLKASLRFAGSVDGPEGELAPNITPDRETGIGKWSAKDLEYFLETGFKPDGDDAQGLMGQVIEHGYGKIGAADRQAIAEYVRSLPPIVNTVRAPAKKK